jgi:hypothetical protein
MLVRLVGVLTGRGSESQLQLENAVLRHQVRVLRRSVRPPELKDRDRALLAAASRALSRERGASFMVTPQTLLRWHRELVRRTWTYRRRGPGRPPLSSQTVDLITRLGRGNPRWGCVRSRASERAARPQAVLGTRDEGHDDDRRAARGRRRVERTGPRHELGASKREAGAVRRDGPTGRAHRRHAARRDPRRPRERRPYRGTPDHARRARRARIAGGPRGDRPPRAGRNRRGGLEHPSDVYAMDAFFS